jgi:hypothetical protein
LKITDCPFILFHLVIALYASLIITPLVSSNSSLDVRLPADSPGTSASSTTKTGRHDIAELLLEVAFKHNKFNQSINLLTSPPYDLHYWVADIYASKSATLAMEVVFVTFDLLVGWFNGV